MIQSGGQIQSGAGTVMGGYMIVNTERGGYNKIIHGGADRG